MDTIRYYRPPDDESKKNNNDIADNIVSTKNNDIEEVEPSSIVEKSTKEVSQKGNQDIKRKKSMYFVLHQMQVITEIIWQNKSLFPVFSVVFVIGFFCAKQPFNPPAFPRELSKIVTLSASSFPVISSSLFKKNKPDSSIVLKNDNQNENLQIQDNVGNESSSSIDNSSIFSLDDKEKIMNGLNDLFSEYKAHMNSMSRVKIELRTFVGYQIVENKANVSLTSHFDEVIDIESNRGNSFSLPILYGLQQLLNSFIEVGKNPLIKPVIMIGLSVSFRLK